MIYTLSICKILRKFIRDFLLPSSLTINSVDYLYFNKNKQNKFNIDLFESLLLIKSTCFGQNKNHNRFAQEYSNARKSHGQNLGYEILRVI